MAKKANKIKEIKVKEEKEEEKEEKGNIMDEKMTEKELRKQYGEKSTFQKVMNIILWVILIGWMVIVLIDFYNVNKKEEPFFCIKENTEKYDDGTVYSCLGVGYKVYRYERSCFSAIEFGPFWSKDRSLEEENCK